MNRRILRVPGARDSFSYATLTMPEAGTGPAAVVCILLSPGAKTRVAPHRLYRKLETEFLAHGIPVLRLDCQGFGDSSEEKVFTEDLLATYNSAQFGRHVPDAVAAMDYAARELNVSQFILGGLCGGALTALYAAAEDRRVLGIYSVGMPVAQADVREAEGAPALTRGEARAAGRSLRRKLFRPHSWVRFLTLKSDYRLYVHLAGNLLRRAFHIVLPQRNADTPVLTPADLPRSELHPLFAPAFFGAARSGAQMLLLFGANDRMLWNYQERFAESCRKQIDAFGDRIRVHVVPDANHVLTERQSTDAARQATREWLDSVFPTNAAVPVAAAGIRAEIVSTAERFRELRDEWTHLLAASPSNSVTLTWEWLHTWWQVYGEDRQLRLILVRENGVLVGAAPLLMRQRLCWHFGIVPYRRMELLASGEEQNDMVCSDYIDWLFLPGKAQCVVDVVLDELEGLPGKRWEEILLLDVWSESPTIAALQATCSRRGLRFEELRRDSCSYITLRGSWDAYLQSVSSSQRYRIRRAIREFTKLGGTYELLSDPTEIAAKYGVLIQLHQRRWTSKGEPGAFASLKRSEFHRRLIPLALEQGWLRLGVLSLQGKPVAAIYNFTYGGRVYFYQSGMVPQDESGLRPGVLLHAMEIQAAIEAGDVEYDFLKRGESSYKDDWTKERRYLVAVRVSRGGTKDALLQAVRRTRSGLRPVKKFVQRLAGGA